MDEKPIVQFVIVKDGVKMEVLSGELVADFYGMHVLRAGDSFTVPTKVTVSSS